MRPIPDGPFTASINDDQVIQRLRFLQRQYHIETGEHIGAEGVVRLLLIEAGWLSHTC